MDLDGCYVPKCSGRHASRHVCERVPYSMSCCETAVCALTGASRRRSYGCIPALPEIRRVQYCLLVGTPGCDAGYPAIDDVETASLQAPGRDRPTRGRATNISVTVQLYRLRARPPVSVVA